ncbi:hypothetical protein HK098_000592 [Nowakowskiella sp. JEL0407]|nr:hypothetical protein HK098_000592 [Nowakowskiella sp. JEL0407]
MAELIEQGKREYALKHFDTATDLFSDASRELVEKFGEGSPECAVAFYWYGNALFNIALQKSTFLGSSNEKETEEDSEQPDLPTAKIQKVGKILVFEDEEEGDAEQADEPENGEKDNETGGAEEEQEEEEEDDMMLAWNILDLTRTILEKMDGEENQKMLAETYLTLGDISLELEQWSRAVLDYSDAVKLKSKLFPPSNRQLSESYFKLALAYEFTEEYDKALENLKLTSLVLQNRVSILRDDVRHTTDPEKMRELEDEIKEIMEGMVPELDEKIKDLELIRDQVGTKFPGDAATASKTSDANGAETSAAAAPSKVVNDVSNLVKKKPKVNVDTDAVMEEKSAKKAKLED